MQIGGGNSIFINGTDASGRPIKDGSQFLSGEFGPAGRTFKNAKNIKTARSNGIFNDFHNSHNRVHEWKYQLENKEKNE